MAQTELRFFGRPRLEIDGAPVEVKSRKGMALLAHLAVAMEPVGRDIVATLLWPEYDQTRARANLRRTLYKLNQTAIAPFLLTEQESVALREDKESLIDVRRFGRLLEVSSPASLTEAVTLYQGEFLAGLYLPDSQPFDEWATVEREKYRREALEALAELTAHHLDEGAWQEAEGMARRQLALDSFRELAWRQLMRALAENGRRAEALTEFERCRQIMWEELSVEPAAATIALAHSLRQRDTAGAAEAAVVEPGSIRQKEGAPPDRETGGSVSQATPYRGLYAFREEDAAYFFGREAFTELLLEAFAGQSIVPLVGPSGSGKSSVIFAGIVPELRRATEWVFVDFRPGPRPFHALAAGLVTTLDDGLSDTDRLIETGKLASAFMEKQVGLHESVELVREKWGRAGRLLLIADQFEELFTHVADVDMRHQFLDLLLDPVFAQQYRPDPTFTLALTLRADFLGQALAYRPFADAMQEADVKLGPMTRPELRRVVVEPAKVVGVPVEEGLATRILDDVGLAPGNLPLLEFALDQLWRHRESGVLTHEAYERIGRVQGALASYADEVIDALGKEDRERARRILIQLARPGEHTEDVRRLALRSELDDAWDLVTHLADARLVVTGRDADGNETVELVHEALISNWERFQGWLAVDRDFRLWQERFRAALRSWEVGGHDESELLRGRALATALGWLEERADDLSRAERQYIERSNAYARRRRRRALFGAALVVAVALSLMTVAFFQWRNARAARDEAVVEFAEQVAVQARSQPEGAYGRALLLAVEALRVADTAATRQTLAQLLLANLHVEQTVRVSLPQPRFAGGGASPDGRIGAFPAEDAVFLWDVQRGERLSTTIGVPAGAATAMADFSPDGGWLAIGQPVAAVFDAVSGAQRGADVAFPMAEVEALALSPGAERLAGVDDGLVAVADVMSGRMITVATATGGGVESAVILGLDFSPEGTHVAAGCSEANVCLWDVETGERVAEIGGAHTEAITAVAFSPDGEWLASGSADGSLAVWKRATGDAWATSLPAPGAPVSAVAFSQDGQRLASAGEEGDVYLWEMSDQPAGAPLEGRKLGSTGNRTQWVAFTGDGERLVTVMSENNSGTFPPSTDYLFTVWSAGARKALPPAVMLQVQDGGVTDIVFGEDGLLHTVDGSFFFREDGSMEFVDGTVDARTWSLPEGSLEASRETAPVGLNVTGATLSAAGRWLAVGPTQGGVLLADLTGPDPVTRTLEGPAQAVIGLAFSSDGRRLAAGGCHEGDLRRGTCRAGELWVWNLDSGKRVGPLVGSEEVIASLAFGDDGRRLVTAGPQLLLWELGGDGATQERIAKAPGRGPDAFVFVAASADGQWLAATQTEGVFLWRRNRQGQWVRHEVEPSIENLTEIAFSPDSRLLAAGNFDGEIALWDVASGRLVARPARQQNRAVRALAFDEDGDLLASGSLDGRLVVWDVSQLLQDTTADPQTLIARACAIANRNLSPAEWQRFFGDEVYRQSCPG